MAWASIQIVPEYERGVIFRLGRLAGAKGPGLFFIIPIIDRIEKKLKGEGWERLVLVKEEDQRVVVSVKSDGEKIVGLLVMALDPSDEAAFVNVVGTIDFKSLESLDINLDESVLDSLKAHMEKK